jgi:hypothetical protein
MGIKLQGGNDSTNLTSVNALHQLRVTTPLEGACAGFVQASTEMDAGDVRGARTLLPLEASDDYRLRVGVDQSVFNATFDSANIQTTHWNSNTSVLANTQALGFLTVNSGPISTSGAAGYVRSWRLFPTYGTYPTYLDMWIREGGYDATNAISEFGFLYLTGTTTQQPIDGIYFRRISGGQLKGVITNNSLDLVEVDFNTSNVPSRHGYGPYDPIECNHYLISFHNDVVRFWINDVMVGEIPCPSQLANFSASSSLPVGFRVNNISATSVGRQVSIGYVNVGQGDQNTKKPWAHAMVGSGQGSYQTQQGVAMGPTVTRGTGTNGHPTSATTRIAGSWSATTNPGLNSLGGLWTSVALSGVVSDSDYPIFAYLNPAGAVSGINTIPGKTLYVTGVRIGDTSVTVAPGATHGIFFSYIVQVEASAVAVATTDSATTTSGKGTVIGGQGFGVAATDPVGTMKPGFAMNFDPPLVVPAGKYCTVVVRPYMAATSGNTLIVTGSVAVNGYFE